MNINFIPSTEPELRALMNKIKYETPFFTRHTNPDMEIPKTEHGFFMRDEGRIIGYTFFDVLDGEDVANTGWALLQNYHGKGLAKLLIQKALDEAGKYGVKNVVATVAAGNWRGVYSELRAGFQVVGESPNEVHGTILHLRKEL